MQIDPQAPVAGRTDTPTKLTPELEQLLATLKLQIGQKAEASVTRVVLLTEAEQQQLLAARGAEKPSAGQQTLLSVLRDPGVKLVELTIRDHPVTTLTNLPLARNSQIQVLVTPKGLLLLPPASTSVAQPPPSPVGSLPVQSPALATNSLQRALPATNPGTAGGVLAGERTLIAPVNRPVTESQTLPQSAAPAKTLLAAATSQALPIAQPLKTLLGAAEAAQRLIARAPSLPGSPVTELGILLNKISSLPIDVTAIKPDTLRQAMNTSGLFYERRLVAESATGREREIQPSPLSERDLKGLLILLTQWNGGQSLATPAPGGQSSPDTLAQLMMSLARLWSPRQAPAKGEPAQSQLSRAVQTLAEKSLAQVQLQQFRTLNTRLQEGAAPAQWHLDIPLKLPDAYGNLYLQLFEPRTAAEEKKSDRQRKSRKPGGGRWRVFLELELDQLGVLAAEVSVEEKAVEATLWSANDDLRHRVHAQLESLRGDLESQGIEVTDLRCSANPPPEQKIRLDYALIDVKT